ncbi:MAG TPA: DUF4190 domain-containing protein [Micromonosporaceae bacterium]
MTYPQQPGSWHDPSASGQPAGYPDPSPVSGAQPAAPQVPPSPVYPAYGYPAPPTAPTTNGLAIAALVCSLAGIATCISAPVGAILGHIARRQIRERGEGGDGMALAAIIVGWIVTGLMLLFMLFYVGVIVFAIANSETTALGTH